MPDPAPAEQERTWNLVDGVPRCDACGYSARDCALHLDHRLCPNPDPPQACMTKEGEHIPPIEGDPPCDEYDEAGFGAGAEQDGLPQCAACGHPRSAHAR